MTRAFVGTRGVLATSACVRSSFLAPTCVNLQIRPLTKGPNSAQQNRLLSLLKSSEIDFTYDNIQNRSWESIGEREFDDGDLGGEMELSRSDDLDDADDDDPSGDDDDSEESEVNSDILEEFDAWSQALEKALVGVERKERSLLSERKKAEDVERTMARAQLIVSNLYLFTSPSTKTVIVQDWENDGKEVELTVDPQYDSASEEADALFAQARKLKRGSQVIGDLLLETEEALQLLKDAKTDLQSCCRNGDVDEGVLRLIQARLNRTSKKTKFIAPALEPKKSSRPKKSQSKNQQRSVLETCVRKLVSPGGCIVWVGRNRRGNEYLSLNLARGNDIWMHARGIPGAHVILQYRRGSPEPTQACLEFCANLAVFYSDSRTESKASVTAAEPKHILKPRGAPLGAVKVREELYTLVGFPDKVPEELKQARDASGQVGEFRSKDKAKRRNKTKAVAKQNQDKVRAEQRAKKRRRRQSSSADSESFNPY